MSDIVSLFSNDDNLNVVAEMKSSVGIQTVDGVPCVRFVTNRGKGSGAQIIPIAQLTDVISALQSIVDQGIPETSGDEDLPAADVIRRTIALDDGVVSFRCRNGKGAKPARVPVEQLSSMVDFLVQIQPAIEKAMKKA